MATALLIAGGGLLAAGQIRQGQIAAAQGEFEKDVAVRNQQALERQAVAEKEASKIEEGRIARKSRLVQARLAAGQAKSGLGLAGSTVDALADAAFQFSFDRNLTLRRGLIGARELQQRGSILATQGRFASTMGRQARTSSFISAAGTGLATLGAAGFGGAGSAGTSTGTGTASAGQVGGIENLGNFARGFLGP